MGEGVGEPTETQDYFTISSCGNPGQTGFSYDTGDADMLYALDAEFGCSVLGDAGMSPFLYSNTHSVPDGSDSSTTIVDPNLDLLPLETVQHMYVDYPSIPLPGTCAQC
jgi:hypothetical protein